ncbi:TPM domain-containing protein [Pedobacter sp. HMF7647]|uniref:TPM domain-containing protein n=1 Tax=Hufsiella arboris TaxID=2695275 RepID=A0A7K1YBV2_9SPHI|nr:TPM domain-containing protein [Hufsiella arboris]MXV51900.1 TPM domain-containing protein [Hufsiella arboris]
MTLFSDEDQQNIRQAIEAAELFTSGEIRICIEETCPVEAIDRAIHYFGKLGMDQTVLRNGVLVYLSYSDRKFAIIGDSGINKLVKDDFWDSTKDLMLSYFKENKLADGIIAGVTKAGEQLKTYFPYKEGDKNELSDDIAFF